MNMIIYCFCMHWKLNNDNDDDDDDVDDDDDAAARGRLLRATRTRAYTSTGRRMPWIQDLPHPDGLQGEVTKIKFMYGNNSDKCKIRGKSTKNSNAT